MSFDLPAVICRGLIALALAMILMQSGAAQAQVPTLINISPNSGSTAGGTTVTLTGTDFLPGTTVTIGGQPLSSVNIVNTTTLTGVVPAYVSGSLVKDVVVDNGFGTSTLSSGFTYIATTPTVTGISPGTGSVSGGTTVTISGTNFTPGTAVTVGGISMTSVTVVNSVTITGIMPAYISGPLAADVIVNNGAGSGTLAGGFTYTPIAPTITSISPISGARSGSNTVISVFGTGFVPGTTVTVGGIAMTSVIVVDTNTLSGTVPDYVSGPLVKDVVVTNSAGSATLSNAYTYSATAPTISGITPATGPVAGGTQVTITGTNLTFVTGVTIGGIALTSVSVVNSGTITGITPAYVSGSLVKDVTVTDAVSAATLAGGFTYNTAPPPPTITSVNPATGPAAGGSPVTITGTNLTGATGVTFAGIAGTSLVVGSATVLTVNTPAHAAGAVDIVVTGPGGSATATAGYTYAGLSAATVTLASSLNPSPHGQPVTFSATVSGSSGVPTGSVTFMDGSAAIGSSTLAAGTAQLTLSTLATGSHSITAVYSGDGVYAAGNSAALIQVVNVPADSIKLRQLQAQVTQVAAQNAGSAISSVVDAAISRGFEAGVQGLPQSGWRFTGSGSGPGSSPSAAALNPAANGSMEGVGSPMAWRASWQSAGTEDSASRGSYSALPALTHGQPEKWLTWADIRGIYLPHKSGPAGDTVLSGSQTDYFAGLTRKFSNNLLAGVLTGYETFHFSQEALDGHMAGSGWSVGSYVAWRTEMGIRFDMALTYSLLQFDGSAGTAHATFDGRRWVLSTGVSGSYAVSALQLEPSLRIYELAEHEDSYRDSLGTDQDERAFVTGRVSAGIKASHAWKWGYRTLSPYLGLYGDYYFNGDNIDMPQTPGALAQKNLQILDGWSARVNAGLTVRLNSAAQCDAGIELGDLGGVQHIWSAHIGLNIAF